MKWIDTHSHIYLEDFANDIEDVLERAKAVGVEKILLPNIDVSSIDQVKMLYKSSADRVDMMMGLHPCSVKGDYKSQLSVIEKELFGGQWIGVGEIGIDLYWDTTTKSEQVSAFETQLLWSCELQLPVSIHSREATEECIQSVEKFKGRVKGVFHCFSGTVEQARRITELGLYLGIGGVVTYKKSDLPQVLTAIGPDRTVLETDSPYLSPVPHRGKKNEPAYLPVIGSKLAEIFGLSLEEISKISYDNSLRVFYASAI